MKKKLNGEKSLSKPTTKKDLEIAVAQIVNAVAKSQKNFVTKDDLKNFATKDDLKNLATKDDLKYLDHKVDNLANKVDGLEHQVGNLQVDVTDIKRRMIDLETDTPTKSEFEELKSIVHNA